LKKKALKGGRLKPSTQIQKVLKSPTQDTKKATECKSINHTKQMPRRKREKIKAKTKAKTPYLHDWGERSPITQNPEVLPKSKNIRRTKRQKMVPDKRIQCGRQTGRKGKTRGPLTCPHQKQNRVLANQSSRKTTETKRIRQKTNIRGGGQRRRFKDTSRPETKMLCERRVETELAKQKEARRTS